MNKYQSNINQEEMSAWWSDVCRYVVCSCFTLFSVMCGDCNDMFERKNMMMMIIIIFFIEN